MNKLTYDTTTHQQDWRHKGSDKGAPKYAIDWTRCEEKFKSPAPQLRVYQGGRIEISSNTYRDPELRRTYANTYGINFQLRSKLKGKLYTPDGERVMKSQIENDILLIDYEFKRVLTGREINYVAPGYPPTSYATVSAASRQPEKEKRLLEQWREVFALATTMHALRPKPHKLEHWQAKNQVVGYLQKPKQLDSVQDELLLWQLGAVQTMPSTFAEYVKTACLLRAAHNYLIFK